MEEINHTNQGQQEALQAHRPEGLSPDVWAIILGVTTAEMEERDIDDATARRIAAQLHGGQQSALCALASTGHIDEQRVYQEIGKEFELQSNPEVREWLNWLGAYCIRRERKEAVEGWHELTAREPTTDQGLGERALSATTEHGGRGDDAERDEQQPLPRIWVGSLTDYNNGRLHGEWIEANQESEQLHEAVQAMLATSVFPEAEEWGIFDYEGFGSLRLDEYETMETVSRIALGIEEHGPAFAAWVAYVGTGNDEQLDRFEDHFRGEFDSMEAYVEDVLDNIGFYHDLDEALKVIPEDLRQYVKMDTEGLARDWGIEMCVVEGADGRVWVFDGQG